MYSDGNFIGNVSFEGNHANYYGGKGDLEDALSALRQLFEDQVHCTFLDYFSRHQIG